MQGTLAGAQLQSVSGAWRIAPSTMGTLHGSVRGAGIRRPAGPPTHLLPAAHCLQCKSSVQAFKAASSSSSGRAAVQVVAQVGGRRRSARPAEALAAFVHSCFLRRQAVSMCAAVSQLGSACLCAAMPLCTLLLDKCRTNALPCLHLPLASCLHVRPLWRHFVFPLRAAAGALKGHLLHSVRLFLMLCCRSGCRRSSRWC